MLQLFERVRPVQPLRHGAARVRPRHLLRPEQPEAAAGTDPCTAAPSRPQPGFPQVKTAPLRPVRQVYLDYFGFVPARRPRGAPAGATAREHVSEGALSVLVVGVDSLSRLNMIRKMPRTRAFLEQRLGSFSMLGYNKVGGGVVRASGPS